MVFDYHNIVFVHNGYLYISRQSYLVVERTTENEALIIINKIKLHFHMVCEWKCGKRFDVIMCPIRNCLNEKQEKDVVSSPDLRYL